MIDVSALPISWYVFFLIEYLCVCEGGGVYMRYIYIVYMRYTLGSPTVHSMSYSGHTVNKFSMCDAWLAYMKYSVYICGTDIVHN